MVSSSVTSVSDLPSSAKATGIFRLCSQSIVAWYGAYGVFAVHLDMYAVGSAFDARTSEPVSFVFRRVFMWLL